MNRATGLAPVRFEIESLGGTPGGGTATTGNHRVAGGALHWREHPYEWIEGSRHVVLGVFERGVLRWYIAEAQLERLPAAARGCATRSSSSRADGARADVRGLAIAVRQPDTEQV